MENNHYHTVVVGGGICGLSTAWRLAKLGKQVLIIERENIGSSSQASSINSGILENWSTLSSSTSVDQVIASAFLKKNRCSLDDVLCAGTMAFYSKLKDIEYVRMPVLLLLENAQQYSYASEVLKLPETKNPSLAPTSGAIVNSFYLQKIEPLLSPKLSGAVIYNNCASVHPKKTLLQLKAKAMKEGVEIVENFEVLKIKNNSSSKTKVIAQQLSNRLDFSKKGQMKRVSCDNVVIACGGMSNAVANKIELHAMPKKTLTNCLIPVVPVVGQMFRTIPMPEFQLKHIICGFESHMQWHKDKLSSSETVPPELTHLSVHGSKRITRHLYGKQSPEGRFLFGGDRRVHPYQDYGLHHQLPRNHSTMFDSVWKHTLSVFSDKISAKMGVECLFGGIMPFSKDGNPIIGKLENGFHNIWTVTGLGGSGFMRGAMSGILLAELMAGEDRLKIAELLSPADPSRFI